MAETVKKNEQEKSQLEHLAHIRDSWSDEIPDTVVHSDSGIKTKARRNWFVGVVASAENALTENEIVDPTKRAVAEKLVERFTSSKFIKQKLTTKNDISAANSMIDFILGRNKKK